MFAFLRALPFTEPRTETKRDVAGTVVRWGSLVGAVTSAALAFFLAMVGFGGLLTFFKSGYEPDKALQIMNLSLELIKWGGELLLLCFVLSIIALMTKPKMW